MEKFYGTLAVVSADNLGSLALGGFKESCTAYRCCRHCMATQETAKTQVKPLFDFWNILVCTYYVEVSLYSSRRVGSVFEISLHTSTNVHFLVVKIQLQYQRHLELTEMSFWSSDYVQYMQACTSELLTSLPLCVDIFMYVKEDWYPM